MCPLSKRLLPGAIFCALVLAAHSFIAGSASASPIRTSSGYLSVYNFETQQYGSLGSRSEAWANWGARADWFYNGLGIPICIYEKPLFAGKAIIILPGQTLVLHGFGQSNRPAPSPLKCYSPAVRASRDVRP